MSAYSYQLNVEDEGGVGGDWSAAALAVALFPGDIYCPAVACVHIEQRRSESLYEAVHPEGFGAAALAAVVV